MNQARKAKESLEGRDIGGRRLHLDYARPRDDDPGRGTGRRAPPPRDRDSDRFDRPPPRYDDRYGPPPAAFDRTCQLSQSV
mgnify:CR=1 FL=1